MKYGEQSLEILVFVVYEHSMKSVCIRRYSGPYVSAVRLNTD